MRSSTLLLLAALGLLLGGCAALPNFNTDAAVARTPCADRVMDQAFLLHNEAKTGLAIFYDERDDHRLYQSYYASVDSVLTARSVAKCWDRRVSHYNAMRNLEDANRQLVHLIKRNMPDEEGTALVSVYREQYGNLFTAN